MEQSLGRLVVKDVLALAIFHESNAGKMAHEGREALLTFTQRFLGLFTLADVDRGADDRGRARPVRGLEKIYVGQDPYRAAVFPPETDLLLGKGFLFSQARQHLIAIRRTEIELSRFKRAGFGTRAVPQHFGKGLIAIEDVAIKGSAQNAGKVFLEQYAVAGFKRPQRTFGLLALGDVPICADDPCWS